jgi:hypothetical protein
MPHQGRSAVLVEGPQRVHAVQQSPPEFLPEGPLQPDVEEVGLLRVDKRLNCAECGACPVVVQGRFCALEEGVERCRDGQIGKVDGRS